MDSQESIDWYKFFEISKNSTIDDIKKSYKRKLIKYHPDNFSNKSKEEQQEAQQNLLLAQKGFNVLSDPNERKKYDSKLVSKNKSQVQNNNMKMFNNSGMGMFDNSGMGMFGDFDSFSKKKSKQSDSSIKKLEEQFNELINQLANFRDKYNFLEKEIEELKQNFTNESKKMENINLKVYEKEKEIKSSLQYLEIIDKLDKYEEKKQSIIKRHLISNKEYDEYLSYKQKKEKLDDEIGKFAKELRKQISDNINKYRYKIIEKETEKSELTEKIKNLEYQYNHHPYKKYYESKFNDTSILDEEEHKNSNHL